LSKIAVIGGGPSGITAAIFAARAGTEVNIYEKNERLGRKILSTGNGRCNFTNKNACIENYNGKNTSFIKHSTEKFWVEETVAFFDELGILSVEEEEGRIYPYSRQAASVCDVLRFEIERLGINCFLKTKACKIEKDGKRFKVSDNRGTVNIYDKVIVATGGMAAPDLGSDGDGYEFAKSFGHSVRALTPVLVQMKTKPEDIKGLKGIKVQASLMHEQRKYKGEILFTDYGISGPPVFKASSYIKPGDEVFIDFLPDYTEEEVFEIIKRRTKRGLTLENMLIGIVNRLVGINVLKYSGTVPLSRTEDTLSDDEIKNLSSALKKRKISIVSKQGWKNAQVTAGGINTDEVNAKTMESRLVKGLYFTGEVLDIDGECGGYNLQWAWSSGYIAGVAASRK